MADKPAAGAAVPQFFATPADFGRWLRQHGDSASELSVGFHKKGSGLPSITWPEAVDEALCVGWIDGVRHGIDASSYRIRFTPRKPGSIWSAVNIARVGVLSAEGRMQPAGLAAFARRSAEKSKVYAYEQASVPALSPDEDAALRAHAVAGAYYAALPPGYRQRMVWWVVSAKQAATRQKRFAAFLDACASQKRL